MPEPRPRSFGNYRVLELIERKAAGETEVVPAPVEAGSDTVVDLMAALEASVAEAKKARTRHPAATARGTVKKKPAEKKAASSRTAKKQAKKSA